MKKKEAICPVCSGVGAYQAPGGSEDCARCKGRGVIPVHHYIWEDLARTAVKPEEISEERQNLFARALDEAHAWLETALFDPNERWRTPSTFLKTFKLGGWAEDGSEVRNKNRAALLFLRSMKKFKPSDPDGVMGELW